MAKSCTRLTSGVESTGSGTSIQSASISPAANSAIAIAVPAFSTTTMSVSGLGLAWTTKVSGFEYATGHRIWTFVGYGSPSSGQLTFTYDEGGFLGWVVDNITGTVSSTPTNANTATGSGTGTAALATLGAFGNAANGTWGYCIAQDAVSHEPGTGFTEVLQRDGLFDFVDSTIFQDANDTTVDVTLGGSAAWGFAAMEIVDSAGGAASPVLGRRIYVMP